MCANYVPTLCGQIKLGATLLKAEVPCQTQSYERITHHCSVIRASQKGRIAILPSRQYLS